ncbi:uncharacterized protein MAM_05987 [Metarhizium album ARSEF 1941]|uniref:Uncharacterized protein n=1 Tax=Metarhizium album (strain ARSEF 1941) TaxID=1081103 RepID=A0A0B2WR97_METAS|nr:uncharacterized protein MAM_05987 [Metarhizium album ARSEF 1941]KHN96139.1 hypothetical protein MAM_05987 [Metarhizium album ARSEF 1941]
MKSFAVLAALSVLAAADPLVPRTAMDVTYFRLWYCHVQSHHCYRLQTDCDRKHPDVHDCLYNKDPNCVADKESYCGQTVQKCYGEHYGESENLEKRTWSDSEEKMFDCLENLNNCIPIVKGSEKPQAANRRRLRRGPACEAFLKELPKLDEPRNETSHGM